MERRIKQADGDRQARHDFKELDEIPALHGKNFHPALRGGASTVSARIILRMGPMCAPKNMCSVAEADASAPK
jgi:hypothetical protein